MEVLGITTMNKTRPLFLVCFLLLAGLFAFNSYADEVTIDWKSGSYPKGNHTVKRLVHASPWGSNKHYKDEIVEFPD